MKIELTKERVDNIFFNTLAERMYDGIERQIRCGFELGEIQTNTISLINQLWCADIISEEDEIVFTHDMLIHITDLWEKIIERGE